MTGRPEGSHPMDSHRDLWSRHYHHPLRLAQVDVSFFFRTAQAAVEVEILRSLITAWSVFRPGLGSVQCYCSRLRGVRCRGLFEYGIGSDGVVRFVENVEGCSSHIVLSWLSVEEHHKMVWGFGGSCSGRWRGSWV